MHGESYAPVDRHATLASASRISCLHYEVGHDAVEEAVVEVLGPVCKKGTHELGCG